jgi:hypothetical protein
MPATDRKFNTSGLQRLAGSIQRKLPAVTRKTFSRIRIFEEKFLFSNQTFQEMSEEQKALIQQNAQKAFFAWMMSKRFLRILTKPHQKRKMYEEIVLKLIAYIEIQSVGRPAFVGECSFDLPLLVNELPRSCVSPFADFHVTGVIPCTTNQITLCVPPPSNAPLVVEKSYRMPFVSSVSVSDLVLPSFPDMSMTFPPPHSDEDGAVTKADSFMSKKESEVFFEQIRNPDVKKTLRKTSKIHRQISEVVNTPNPDASLGPSDWFNKKYPGSPLSLILKSEQ